MSSTSQYELDYSGFNFNKYNNIVIPTKPVKPNGPPVEPSAINYLIIQDYYDAYAGYQLANYAYQQAMATYRTKAREYNTQLRNSRKLAKEYINEITKHLDKITKANKCLENIITRYESVKGKLETCSGIAHTFSTNYVIAKQTLHNSYSGDPGSKVSNIQAKVSGQDISAMLSHSINEAKNDITKRNNILKKIKTKNGNYKKQFRKALPIVKAKGATLETMTLINEGTFL